MRMGSVRNRQDISAAGTGLPRLRFEFRRRFPEPPSRPPVEEVHLWEDEEEDGLWWTDYPPPDGFSGVEEGEWGDEEYRRTLSDAEQEALDRDLALDRAEEEAERASERAEAAAERDRVFGLAPPAASEDRVEQPEDHEQREHDDGEHDEADET